MPEARRRCARTVRGEPDRTACYHAPAMFRGGLDSLMLRASPAACLLVAAGCASAPVVVAPTPPTLTEQLSWILRLENERRLADPLPEPAPVPEAVGGTDGEVGDEVNQDRGPLPPAPPRFVRPDLVELAAVPEAYLRRRAALAIGRVRLSEGVEPLIERLADPEIEVRQMAAFGLGLIGDPAAVDALVEALDDVSPKVQGRAAQALGLIGAPAVAPAIGAMTRRHVTSAFDIDPEDVTYPHNDEAEAFRLGLYALGELKAFEPLAEAVLGDGDQPILWWWPVAYALGRTEDPRALTALVTLAGVQGSFGVALAARGIGEIGDPRGIDPLTDLLDLDRRDRRVVTAAVRALGAIDEPRAAAALDRFVRSRRIDPPLRLAAVEALVNHPSEASIEVFIELLGHPSPPLRAASVRALAAADPESFIFVLSGLGSDPDWRVRAALADALRHVDPAAAAPRLRAMVDDADQRVVPAVLDALVAAGAPEAPDILLERLAAPDVVVRKTAARLLGTLQPPGAAPALADAYVAAEPDPSHVARAAIIDALGACGGDAAVETLRTALGDRDWAVRVRAAAHLERLEPGSGHDAAIRPAPGLRRVDYAARHLTNPSVSPHVYVETARGTIEIELAVLDAPLTTESFMTLARDGFFDGLTFHRVTSHEFAHTGDPRSDDEGGPGFTLRDELSELPFLRGTVGMARDSADTGGSRFFITHSPQPQLDGRHTAFGRVVAGMEVVDALEAGDRIERVLVWDGVQPFRGAESR